MTARQHAIVQTRVPGSYSEWTGTAFFVSRRLALTAWHCLGETDEARNARQRIDINDADGHEWPMTVRWRDSHIDAALLEVKEGAPDAAQWLWLDLSVPVGVGWETDAFPASARDVVALDGRVRKLRSHRDPLAIELDCNQADDLLDGASGAPVIARLRVIGILGNQLKANLASGEARPILKKAYAVPIWLVLERCQLLAKEVGRLSPDLQRLPFVPHVEADLRAPTVIPLLPEAGTVLALPSVRTMDREHLPPLVAEGILRRGPRRAVHVLEPLTPQLPQSQARQILFLTASVWIDDAAAEALGRVIVASAHGTVIGLNASRPALGARYVHRAGYPTASHPGWLRRLRSLPECAAERRANELLPLARTELARHYGCTDEELDDEYAADDFERPVILVVPPPLAPADGVEAIHAAFPRVQLLLLCGPGGLDDLRQRFPTAVVVEPPLLAEQEMHAEAAYASALRDMAQCYTDLEDMIRSP